MKIFSFLFISLFSLSIFAGSIKGKVIKVYDGDTIRIIDEDGGKFKIRFADIDAPEFKQRSGLEAKTFLYNLIYNKEIRVKFLTIDIYGRIVGTVYLKKNIEDVYAINVNEEIVKNGYAWFYEGYSKNEKIKVFELEARKNKLGLWKEINPQEPWNYRKEQKNKGAK